MVSIKVSNKDAIKMFRNAEWHIDWYTNMLNNELNNEHGLLTPQNIKNLKKSLKYWQLHAHQIKMALIIARVKVK